MTPRRARRAHALGTPRVSPGSRTPSRLRLGRRIARERPVRRLGTAAPRRAGGATCSPSGRRRWWPRSSRARPIRRASTPTGSPPPGGPCCASAPVRRRGSGPRWPSSFGDGWAAAFAAHHAGREPGGALRDGWDLARALRRRAERRRRRRAGRTRGAAALRRAQRAAADDASAGRGWRGCGAPSEGRRTRPGRVPKNSAVASRSRPEFFRALLATSATAWALATPHPRWPRPCLNCRVTFAPGRGSPASEEAEACRA